MGTIKIAYLADYVSQDIIKSRNLTYSLAGSNKMKSIVECIEKAGMEVIVISPACNNNKGFRFYRLEREKVSFSDVIYMPFISFPCINLVTSMAFIILYLLFMVATGKYNRILFYNHSPKFVIPLLIMKFLVDIPIYVEYEDSYFRNVKKPIKRIYGFFLKQLQTDC